ncbi:MAG: hypothetical protein M1358_03615, partial [Chloroflexi bacterium]|nr:hypothetical protein [Chloroflexota bacterium]
MGASRIALGIGVTLLIALVLGCSGPAKAPALTPSTVSKTAPAPPAPVPTVPLAKVKSISQAKPVDPSSTRGPRLAIDADEVDFGDVPYQTAV